MKQSSKEDLLKTVYKYFPKDVDTNLYPQRYNQTDEIKLLSKVFIENFNKQEKGEFDYFYDALQALDPSKHFHKYGLYISNDRAHNLQFGDLKGTTLYSICLNISIIAPYYTMYVLETEVGRFLKKPVDFFTSIPLNTFRNIEKEIEYEPLLKKIENLVEETFSYQSFPNELIDEVIPDINHQSIRMGEFTMFNAFFLDKYSARI